MRAPAYSNEPKNLICVNCDSSQQPSTSQATVNDSVSASTNSDERSGISTPLTDVSPPPSPPFVLPPPSEETLRRRAQSDRASQEIGNLMLRGYTMLADECPNPTCYGIPLVRAPGDKETTPKECVVCGSRYMPNGEVQIPGQPKPNNSNTNGPKIPEGGVSESKVFEAHDNSTSAPKRPSSPRAQPGEIPRSKSSSPTIANLHKALDKLDELLVDATNRADISRIRDCAEAISKVATALKDLS